VPSVVGFTSTAPNATDASKLNTEQVCGIVTRIYGRNRGLSSGVAKTTAKFTHPGGRILPGVDVSSVPGVFNEIELQFNQVAVGGTLGASGFSFYAKINFELLNRNTRIFDFTGANNLWLAGSVCDNTRGRVCFHSNVGRDRHTLNTQDQFVASGEDNGYLFTMSPEGECKIWKDGVLKVSNKRRYKYAGGQFDSLKVAPGESGRNRNDNFQGFITDVRMWNHDVPWVEAVAGTAPEIEPQDDEIGAENEILPKCWPNKKNTWDFLCADEVPDDHKANYGGDEDASGHDTVATGSFDKREENGELAVCGPAMDVKGTVFHGKFGDGLTGEYFAVRTGRCTPPWLFGRLPGLVRVDPGVDFNGGFLAAHNEFAVRWTGKILISEGGDYSFSLGSKDGSSSLSAGNCSWKMLTAVDFAMITRRWKRKYRSKKVHTQFLSCTLIKELLPASRPSAT